jgi:adenylate cyclase
VRGFSRISEGLKPKEIIGFLIEFLTPMTDILLGRKATVDKYIGDAIVAFWNAPLDDPDHPRNAARAALAMVEQLKVMNAAGPRDSGRIWPGEVKIGIGLNTGLCCVGNMGSAQRLSYSLIGDTVNLAARIEGLTKIYGTPIALGGEIAARLEGFALLELDRVRVVGRDMPETLYALIGDEQTAARKDFQALATAQTAMLAAYRACDWKAARASLATVAQGAGSFGLETLAALYSRRIARFVRTPPDADWNGVYQATEK